MSGGKDRLARLLELRKKDLDDRVAAFTQARRELHAATEAERDCEAAVKRAGEERNQAARENTSLTVWVELNHWLEAKECTRARAAVAVSEARALVSRAQVQVTQARIAHKQIEALIEQKAQRQRVVEARKEQKAADEHAANARLRSEQTG